MVFEMTWLSNNYALIKEADGLFKNVESLLYYHSVCPIAENNLDFMLNS